MITELDLILGEDRLCLRADPETFFADDPKPAKAICADCQAVDACRTYALSNKERWGVWGGLSEWERHRWGRMSQAAQDALITPPAQDAKKVTLVPPPLAAVDEGGASKTCTGCTRMLPLNRFKKRTRSADGLDFKCRACLKRQRIMRQVAA